MDGQALIEVMVAWWVRNETGTAVEAMAADLLIHATAAAYGESAADATGRVSAMIDEARGVAVTEAVGYDHEAASENAEQAAYEGPLANAGSAK